MVYLTPTGTPSDTTFMLLIIMLLIMLAKMPTYTNKRIEKFIYQEVAHRKDFVYVFGLIWEESTEPVMQTQSQ